MSLTVLYWAMVALAIVWGFGISIMLYKSWHKTHHNTHRIGRLEIDVKKLWDVIHHHK